MAKRFLDMKAAVLKALAHPTRLAVVEMLSCEGEKCVCEIAERLSGSDRTTLSKHLAILKAAGILSDRKVGLKVLYRINCPCVPRFVACIEKMVRARIRREESALRVK